MVSSYHVRTFGCQMNERDSERIAAILESMGYLPGDEDADIVVVNTCSVREKPEHKVYSELGRYGAHKRRRPDSILAVAGCVAQQEGEQLLKRAPHLDLVLGTRSIARLPDLISEVKRGRRLVAIEMDSSTDGGLFGAERPAPKSPTAFVVAMTGCSNHCTYCVVPSVRGPAVSRPSDEILEEVKSLVRSGVKEVTLLGQNVNAYGLVHRGADIPVRHVVDRTCVGGQECPPPYNQSAAEPDFAGLLEMVCGVEGIERVRFVTSHPRDFSDRLIRAIADNPKVCEYLHLPMQAGSSAVLKRMGRGYAREDYFALIERIRRVIPHMALTSDFIVGFPGETDDDFKETLDAIERVRYHQIYSFRYSERPNTAALQMGPPVEPEIRFERLYALQARQDEITQEIMEATVGTVEKILIEGPSKTDLSDSTGRTRTNLPVHVRKRIAGGRIITVKIARAMKHSLLGEVIE